jgi:hypothetical protein
LRTIRPRPGGAAGPGAGAPADQIPGAGAPGDGAGGDIDQTPVQREAMPWQNTKSHSLTPKITTKAVDPDAWKGALRKTLLRLQLIPARPGADGLGDGQMEMQYYDITEEVHLGSLSSEGRTVRSIIHKILREEIELSAAFWEGWTTAQLISWVTYRFEYSMKAARLLERAR